MKKIITLYIFIGIYAPAIFPQSLDYYDTAIEKCNKAIKNNPDNYQALWERGNLYGDINQIDKAIADFTNVIRIKPDFAEAFLQLGLIYYRPRQVPDTMCVNLNKKP